MYFRKITKVAHFCIGIFVPFENSNAIAKAVVELLDNPAKMKSVSDDQYLALQKY